MEEKYLNVGSYKIRYLEEGNQGINVVLLHGLGSQAERWINVIPSLSKRYHVIAPDIIGFGYSDKPLVDYTPEFFTNFVFDFMNSLGIKRTVLIGSSLGGQIAAQCASSQSDKIERLVLVSPSGTMRTTNPTLNAYTMAALYPNEETVKMAYQMMSSISKGIEQKTVERFIESMSRPNAKMAFLSTILSFKNAPLTTERLSRIVIPTLLIWGKNDTMIPIQYAKDFVLSIKNCQLVVMENCGHRPHAEEPSKFSDIVLRFLDAGN